MFPIPAINIPGCDISRSLLPFATKAQLLQQRKRNDDLAAATFRDRDQDRRRAQLLDVYDLRNLPRSLRSKLIYLSAPDQKHHRVRAASIALDPLAAPRRR